MVGKGKETMASVQRSLLGGQSIRPRRVGTTEYASTNRATTSGCYIARCDRKPIANVDPRDKKRITSGKEETCTSTTFN